MSTTELIALIRGMTRAELIDVYAAVTMEMDRRPKLTEPALPLLKDLKGG